MKVNALQINERITKEKKKDDTNTRMQNWLMLWEGRYGEAYGSIVFPQGRIFLGGMPRDLNHLHYLLPTAESVVKSFQDYTRCGEFTKSEENKSGVFRHNLFGSFKNIYWFFYVKFTKVSLISSFIF